MENQSSCRGQALVMVTLSLIAMFGLMGLAVDFGWGFYIKRSAQAAADAGALAAVQEAMRTGVRVVQDPAQPCAAPPITDDPATNLDNGCIYAWQNGFGTTGNQLVTIQSNITSPPPTAPGVSVHYWVTMRARQQIPQLFSVVLGNLSGASAARATAAIADVVTIGSLILLNRPNDPIWDPGLNPQGNDMMVESSAIVTVPGGILMASAAGGPDVFAGDFGGTGTGQRWVHTPFTYINSGGALDPNVQTHWDNWYEPHDEGSMFRDPFEGKGQPPLTDRTLTAHGVPCPSPCRGATLTTAVCPNWVCPEGVYFAVDPNGIANGAPIVLPTNNNLNGATLQFGSRLSGFSEYTFFGGLQGQSTTVDFGPGRYVMAGVNAISTPNQQVPVLSLSNAVTVTGGALVGDNQLADAGRVMLLTDSTYPGLTAQKTAVDTWLSANAGARVWPAPGNNLYFGTSNFQAGNNASSSVSLYGIDKTRTGVVPQQQNVVGYSLTDIGNVLMWQDQRNSMIGYETVGGDTTQTNGHYDTSCGGLNTPCPPLKPPACSDITLCPPATEMTLTANQNTTIEGVVYQPRGAQATVWAGTGYSGPIALVTGSINVHSGARLTLNGPVQPMTTTVCALVE